MSEADHDDRPIAERPGRPSRKGYVRHHTRLTNEEIGAVAHWVIGATEMMGGTHPYRTFTVRLGLGPTSLRTWANGKIVPSREMLDWMARASGHPLPDHIRELGAPVGHLSEKVKRAQAAWERHEAMKGARLPLPAPVAIANGQAPPAEPAPDPALDHRARIQVALAQLVNELDLPADTLTFERVLEFIRSIPLTGEQRLALNEAMWAPR